MREIEFTVGGEYEGAGIKDYLRRAHGFSQTLISRVKFGGVFVNGENVHMRQILHTGDTVRVVFPHLTSENVAPIEHPLEVLYEDEHILCVNKPTNMPVHPSRGNHLVTLANAVAHYLGEPFVFRAVNRLDRDTSGIVVIAKNALSAAALSEAMKRGEFQKYYRAILCRTPKETRGIIDAPIEREAPDSIKRTVREDGKRAVTEYEVNRVYSDGSCACDIRLHTGRTHQIRVHMAYIGAPLKNDFLYGEITEPGTTYSLVCRRIVFLHPITKETMDITVD